MVKQTQTIRRFECSLSVFDHFVGLALKGLKNHNGVLKSKYYTLIRKKSRVSKTFDTSGKCENGIEAQLYAQIL